MIDISKKNDKILTKMKMNHMKGDHKPDTLH